MYSGGESTDSQKYTKWAMNPAAYQNAPNDQVDWAALAQQWIIMKEAGPPPIPGDHQSEKNKEENDMPEGGEAEMDMDTERDDALNWNPPGPEDAPPAPGAEAWTNWNPPGGQNWNWGNNWNPPSGVPPPPPGITATKPPLLPTPNNLYSGSLDGGNDNAVPYTGFNSSAQPLNNLGNQPAYWTGLAVGKITQTEIKPHNKRYSKVNVPTKVTIITPAATAASLTSPPVNAEPTTVVTSPLPTLDANKRKQLPAWIREGLEKMERDKQKQMEKEKEKLARDEYTEKIKQEELEKMELLKTTIKEKNLLRKSRFESDNENSDDDLRKKRKVSPPPPVPLTPEELIMKVRKTMTEILLKVTNQLIEQTCKDERQRYIKKHRASDQLVSAPSGAIIKAKLGLGAYDEESSSSQGSDTEDRRDERSDSDAELKESIKKRQAAFSKTEQEIEDRLAEVERKKGPSRNSSMSRSSSPDSRDNESQVEANAQEQENNPHRKGSPDNNSTASSSYMDSKSRRRSSSTSDSRSKNRDTSREKSRSRSESLEPHRKNSSRYSKSPKRRSRSSSTIKSSKRGRSADSYRRERSVSKKRSRRSRSGSRYSRRSRSHSRSSYSSRKSPKRSRYSSRRSRSRSRSRDRRHYLKKSSSSKSYDSKGTKSRRSRSRSYERSKRRSSSSTRSPKKSRSRRSSSRSRRRSSRSSSRGKRSYRR